MERIIGEIPGEIGAQTRTVVRTDGSADIDGLALVSDINAQFGCTSTKTTYTTVGGYVLGRLGRRARVGDTIDVERRRMRVEAVDGLRVAKVWLSKPKQTRRQRTDRGMNTVRCSRASVQSARSSRSALAITIDRAPVSARTAIHSVATPATAMTTNAALSTIEIAMLARMFRTVARLRRSA